MYKNYKYYGGTNWLAVFSVPLSLSNPSPTTKENATLGIQLWAAGQRLLTNCPCCFTKCWLLWITIQLLMNLKNKSFSSTSPPSPLGSTCRKSTLPLMVLKESQGYLHPGKAFTNYLPISDIASSRHEHRPSHSSCSLGLAPWNLKFGLSPLFGDPKARWRFLTPSWCNWHPLDLDGGGESAAKGQNCPHLLQASFQNALFLLKIHFAQILQSMLRPPLHTPGSRGCRWPPLSSTFHLSLLGKENNLGGHNFQPTIRKNKLSN